MAEIQRVHWYYGVNHKFKPRFLKSLQKEHIIANQHTLQEWCLEDLPAIAFRQFGRRLSINVRVHYILQDDEPRFGYACYGNFFFRNEIMYVITNDPKMRSWHNYKAAEWLFSHAEDYVAKQSFLINEEYIDEETGECEVINPLTALEAVRNIFKRENLYVVQVLFAGTRTNMRDKNTYKSLYTGDVVSVKKNRNGRAITAGLGVFFN